MQGEKGPSNEKVWFQGVARIIVHFLLGESRLKSKLNYLLAIDYKQLASLAAWVDSKA
jgi:hypothetical protein